MTTTDARAKIPVGTVQDAEHEMTCDQATYLLQLWTGNPVTDAYFRDQHHVTVTWENRSYTRAGTWLPDALSTLWKDLVWGYGLGTSQAGVIDDVRDALDLRRRGQS